MDIENEEELISKVKEMIRLNIKPNYAALGREYKCDYRTAKSRYERELKKENGVEIEEKIRNHIIDEYKEIIDDKLENTVYNKLSTMANQYINDKDEFENIIKNQYVDPKQDKLKKIDELNLKIAELKRKQDSLYDDKFNNIISVETYQRLFKTTEEDIKTANEKLEKLKEEISSINEDSSCYVEYLDIIKSFLDMKNPTREIMNRLIDKIYVTKDKKLEIHYRIKKSEVLV